MLLLSLLLYMKELQGNDSDLYLSPGEDALLDSSSDVSSISKKKNLRKSVNMLSPSTPPNNKIPIYNETFVDLTNAGLTSFPIETAEKYRKIQVRCMIFEIFPYILVIYVFNVTLLRM